MNSRKIKKVLPTPTDEAERRERILAATADFLRGKRGRQPQEKKSRERLFA